MSTQKIMITFFIVFLSLFFIVSLTYTFTDSKPISNDIFSKNIGMYTFTASGAGAKIQSSSPDSFFVDTVNYTDSVYGLGTGYSKSVLGNNVVFFLKEKGIFLFDLGDISNNYTINEDSFRLKMQTPGKIFVDTRNQDIKIFSLDSVVSIDLLQNHENMTSLALHPKMFFSFNPIRNRFLKNADLLRLETLTNILYFPSGILSPDGNLSLVFAKKFDYVGDHVGFTFLNTVFSYLFSQNEKEKYDEGNIKNHLISVPSLPGIDYIDQYFVLFFNTQKKIAYYKKNIITDLNKGFSKPNILEKEDILENLQNFKDLDDAQYQKFLPVLYYYYQNYFKINSLDYIQNTLLLSDILMEINGNKKKNYQSYLYLNKIYSLVNLGKFSPNDLQTHFLEFLQTFFKEKHISMSTTTFFFKVNDSKMVGELEYLSLFVKNMLLNDVTFSDTSNLSNILHVFKVYETLNENINTIKNDEKAETIIVENSGLIEKILSEMRNNFFEAGVNDKGLLILKKDDNISVDVTDDLNLAMTSFFKFYSLKRGSLSDKNQIYNDIYQKNYATYSAYYLALSNYQEYLMKYDTTTKALFDTKTILETQKDIQLNQENLLTYLQSFHGVDTNGMHYTIENNQYYTVSNLNINGEIFAFNLYPKDGNKMTQIFRDGQKLPLTYNLDDIKQIWDTALETASDADKDKYTFANFFLNIFSGQTYKENEQFVDQSDTIQETKNVRLFKSDKLLGERGEFSILSGYLDLKYNNVLVTENTNNFDIHIKDTSLHTNVTLSGEDTPILGEMSGDYVFSQNNHYFKNIVLKFYDQNIWNTQSEKVNLFSGKSFFVHKNINIVDFKNEMNSIIQNIFTTNN